MSLKTDTKNKLHLDEFKHMIRGGKRSKYKAREGENAWVKHNGKWIKVYIREVEDGMVHYGKFGDEDCKEIGAKLMREFRRKKPEGCKPEDRMKGILKEMDEGYDRYAPENRRRNS